MKLTRLRLKGFRSVGSDPVELSLERLTFLLGPNGTGKTAVLHALARMFGAEQSMRRLMPADFHVPAGEEPGVGTARSLWLEAEFVFPEAGGKGGATIPPNFSHMRLESADGDLTVRFRLVADLDEDGEVVQDLLHVLASDDDGEPTRTAVVNRFDRRAIRVHYLPARRDPSQHVSYAASTLLGQLLRSVDWKDHRDAVSELGKKISQELSANPAVAGLATTLASQWKTFHSGSHLTDPGLSFVRHEIEGVLRHVTLEFSPGHAKPAVDFSLLSDGQLSLLYISLVLASQEIGRETLAQHSATFDVDRLRPPVFTMLAVEEPENSLSPHYLGRVLSALTKMTNGHDAQAVVATHSAALMRRVEPAQVRYLRLDTSRRTTVAGVVMPPTADEAFKFVQEALHAYPELYFARLVILGEGASEEVVLPRMLRAAGLVADSAAISVVPLGGRHVNHFWRLLHGLGIPHVTLLDLDIGRHQGGWGRITYASRQLLLHSPAGATSLTEQHIDGLKKITTGVREPQGDKWLNYLESQGVFFSNPLDLDLALIAAFPAAYEIKDEDRIEPSEDTVGAVLGKTGTVEAYENDEKLLFDAYRQRFKLGSKPVHHLTALASLEDPQLLVGMPSPIKRLVEKVRTELAGLPE